MDKHIIDGMKNESKPARNLTIFLYIMTFLAPFIACYMFEQEYTVIEIVLFTLFWFMLASFCLYGWLYVILYRVEITEKNIKLKTLFTKLELNISEIEKYSYARYKKSVFYQFLLFYNNKKVLINTRYKDEFIEILENNNIPLKESKKPN